MAAFLLSRYSTYRARYVKCNIAEIFETIEPPTGKGAVALAPGPYACWVTRHPDNPFAFMDSGPKSLTEAWRQCMAYKMHIPVNALAPPLALLVLGYVGAWVTKGFVGAR